MQFSETAVRSDPPTVAGEYQRRGIFYINRLFYKSKVKAFRKAVEDSLTRSILRPLTDGRFDLNQIPSTSLTKFVKKTKRRFATLAGLGTQLNQLIVPAIAPIVQAQAVGRTESYRTESERVRFLTAKAKELGVSRDLLEQVWAYTYVVVPYVESRTKLGKGLGESWLGGVAWFRLHLIGDSAYCELDPLAGGTVQSDTPAVSMPWTGPGIHGYRDVSESVAKGVTSPFGLSSQVLTTEGNSIYITMTSDYGVRVDGVYELTELVNYVEVPRGFVRIVDTKPREEGDLARARAKPVTAGGADRGMFLKEVYHSYWDLDFSFSSTTFDVGTGTLGDVSHPPYVRFKGRSSASSQCIGLGLTNNASAAFGEPQTFVNMRGQFAWSKLGWTVEGTDWTLKEMPTWIARLDLGIAKRSYFKFVGLEWGGRAGILYAWQNWTDTTHGGKYYLSMFAPGVSVEGGLCIWAHPSFVIRFLVERKWYEFVQKWTFKKNEKEVETPEESMPAWRLSPLEFRVVLSVNGGALF